MLKIKLGLTAGIISLSLLVFSYLSSFLNGNTATFVGGVFSMIGFTILDYELLKFIWTKQTKE